MPYNRNEDVVLDLRNPFSLPAGQERILTFVQEHPKGEYLKITADKVYNVRFVVKWSTSQTTTCPLQVTLYKVTSEYSFVELYSHVTVSPSGKVNLDKTFPFDLKNGERICMSVKNLSPFDFNIESALLDIS